MSNSIDFPDSNTLPPTAKAWFEPFKCEVQNNDWASREAGSYASGSQTCFLTKNDNPVPMVAFAWDWDNANQYAVSAYPELIVGKKPWEGASNHDKFPMLVEDAAFKNKIIGDYDYTVDAEGSWNAAFDLWICGDQRCDKDSIVAEVMVWVEAAGPRSKPAGGLIDSGHSMHPLYHAPAGTVRPWEIMTFLAKVPKRSDQLDLTLLIKDLLHSRGLLEGHWFLSSVSLGHEVWNGTGISRIRRFRVSV